MRPMSLAESGESTGGISLGKLFEGEFEPSRNKTGIYGRGSVVLPIATLGA